MKRKRCFKCGIVKDIDEFYKHAAMADGHLGKCKECTKKDTRKRYNELVNDDVWIETERKRNREKYYRLEYKEKYKPSYERKKKQVEGYKLKYPEKKLATNVSQHMKKKNKSNHFHHWSYNEEHRKDVIELKPKEHSKIHRFLLYDNDRMMYVDVRSGELLDTKSKHLEFIKNVLKTEDD